MNFILKSIDWNIYEQLLTNTYRINLKLNLPAIYSSDELSTER